MLIIRLTWPVDRGTEGGIIKVFLQLRNNVNTAKKRGRERVPHTASLITFESCTGRMLNKARKETQTERASSCSLFV